MCHAFRRLYRPSAVLVAALATLMVMADFAVAGQGQDASIIGQVTDESGAVLPGVTVTATSPALQVPQVIAVTNEQGEYRLTPLPIGTYAVEYELPGFGTLRREDLRLTAGFVARVDVQLKIGSARRDRDGVGRDAGRGRHLHDEPHPADSRDPRDHSHRPGRDPVGDGSGARRAHEPRLREPERQPGVPRVRAGQRIVDGRSRVSQPRRRSPAFRWQRQLFRLCVHGRVDGARPSATTPPAPTRGVQISAIVQVGRQRLPRQRLLGAVGQTVAERQPR